ncbi:MAG TPA: MBL fold metallo-hydrolase [Bacilli bacterium]|nr:MBL fold metallo-hydrolase [Bacilli bacterium]
MKVAILGSGSKGNSTYIETEKYKILIDLGLSVKYINSKLKTLNTGVDEIDYILITHLHNDHIKSLTNFSKERKTQICITPNMYKSLKKVNDNLRYFIYEDKIVLNDLIIDIINTSHDSVDSRGFLITENKSSLVYITDTGYLNKKYLSLLANKNMYIMESNHDPKILREGKYPLWLQRRILSSEGHLCNEDAATYLAKLIGKNTKKVILAHLSKENNTEEVALNTFFTKMTKNNIKFKNVCCAKQDEMSEVIII